MIHLNLVPQERASLLERLLSIHADAMAIFDAVDADRLDSQTAQRALTMNQQARSVMHDLAEAVRNTVPAHRLAEFDADLARRTRR